MRLILKPWWVTMKSLSTFMASIFCPMSPKYCPIDIYIPYNCPCCPKYCQINLENLPELEGGQGRLWLLPGTRQFSLFEVGEDNSKFKPKKLRKIQIHWYGQTGRKAVIGVFKHAESKSGLYFVITPLLHRFFGHFWVQTHDVFCRFSVKRLNFGWNQAVRFSGIYAPEGGSISLNEYLDQLVCVIRASHHMPIINSKFFFGRTIIKEIASFLAQLPIETVP